MIGSSVVAKHVRPFAGIPYGMPVGVVVALLLIQPPWRWPGKATDDDTNAWAPGHPHGRFR